MGRSRLVALSSMALFALAWAPLAAVQDRAKAVVPAAQLPAEMLETAGLTDEARTQALAAIANAKPVDQLRYIELLKRIRDRQAPSGASQTPFDRQLAIGQSLLKAELYEDAHAALLKAVELAPSDAQRARVIADAQSATTAEDARLWTLSGSVKKTREIVETAVAALVTGVVGLLLLFPGRRIAQWISSTTSRSRGRKSKNVVIHEFEDTTETGLGKGLPDLVRSLYAEQQRIAAKARAGGALLVPHRPRGSLPLLSRTTARGEVDIDLEVAGVKVAKVFQWWDGMWNTPRHNVRGTVYYAGVDDVRATVWIEGVAGSTRTWDGPVFGARQPHDAAYRIVFAILEEWGK